MARPVPGQRFRPMHVLWEVPPQVRRAAARVPTRHDRTVVEQALARYAAGESRATIAEELAVHPYTLSLWVRRAGLPSHGRRCQRPPRLINREIAEIVDAVRQYGSIRSAARAIGRNESSVRRCLRRHAPDMVCPDAEHWRPKTDDPQLPVEPLARLLDDRVGRGYLITKLARDADTTERRINAIRNREYATVRLSTADRLCMAAGTTLAIVYPAETVAA